MSIAAVFAILSSLFVFAFGYEANKEKSSDWMNVIGGVLTLSTVWAVAWFISWVAA